jgi:general L-amino acid transport system ATP-binding protein
MADNAKPVADGGGRATPEMRTTANEVAVDVMAVNKWFGSFHVLRDVNLKVMRGERIVICGPSGSGKSTLLRCINRIEDWQQGSVIVDGVELTEDLKAIDEVRREVGMVFQQFNLFPHLHRAGELHAGADARAQHAARGGRGAGAALSRARAHPEQADKYPRSSPAASSSASRSRVRFACSPRSCCSTSRPPRSIPRWSRRCSTPWSGSRWTA